MGRLLRCCNATVKAIELGNVEEDGWTPLPIKSGLQF